MKSDSTVKRRKACPICSWVFFSKLRNALLRRHLVPLLNGNGSKYIHRATLRIYLYICRLEKALYGFKKHDIPDMEILLNTSYFVRYSIC